jgi:hypothetical protein
MATATFKSSMDASAIIAANPAVWPFVSQILLKKAKCEIADEAVTDTYQVKAHVFEADRIVAKVVLKLLAYAAPGS